MAAQGSRVMKPKGIGRAGLISWVHTSLAVEDFQAAIRFFEEAFGFEMHFKEEGMNRQIESIAGTKDLICDLAILRNRASGHMLELIEFKPPLGLPEGDRRPFRPGAAHVAFVVEDLATAKAAVEALGAITLGEVTSFEDGPSIYCRVPGGAFIEIEQLIPR